MIRPEEAFIDSVTFSDGTKLDLDPDSIVAIVGPNNAGKSQAIKDIYALVGGSVNTVVAKDVTVRIPDRESFIKLLEEIAVISEERGPKYSGFGFAIDEFALQQYDKVQSIARGAIQKSLYVHLDTAARLGICEPPKRTDYDKPKQHPILFAAFDDSVRESLSLAFRRAFGDDVCPNLFSGDTVPLCIGPSVITPGNMMQSELVAFYNDQYKNHKRAHEQGDGMRSFLGVLLYFAIDYYRGIFIDEPEAFLHPPQAAILGSEIASNSQGRQVFLATHSKELLSGLLSTCSERVKVVRITRVGDTNDVSVLGNRDVAALSATTLLKYSDVVNSLFHDSVVLCESDADCKFYSAIVDKLKSDGVADGWPLLLPTGGKQRMKQYADLLNRLRIGVKVVPDIDILNDRTVLKDLVRVCGGDWRGIEEDYTAFCAGLSDPKKQVSVDYFKSELEKVISECEGVYLEEEHIEGIKGLLPRETKWTALKRTGRGGLKGEQITRFDRIDTALRASGIHIVRVGELECFVKEVDAHGPAWVNAVLERYPDLNDHVYSEAQEFVKEWLCRSELVDSP